MVKPRVKGSRAGTRETERSLGRGGMASYGPMVASPMEPNAKPFLY